MVRTVSPNAKDTPSSPMPTLGKAAAKTALPQPPKTSQKVPIASAVQRLLIFMGCPFVAVRNVPKHRPDSRLAIPTGQTSGWPPPGGVPSLSDAPVRYTPVGSGHDVLFHGQSHKLAKTRRSSHRVFDRVPQRKSGRDKPS